MASENKHNQTTDLLAPLKRAKPTKQVWGDTPKEQCEYIIKNWDLWKIYKIFISHFRLEELRQYVNINW